MAGQVAGLLALWVVVSIVVSVLVGRMIAAGKFPGEQAADDQAQAEWAAWLAAERKRER